MPLDSFAESEIRAAAGEAAADPAPLLAIAEVEAGGRVLVEAGGGPTAPIRFLPHVFHRRLRPESRPCAMEAGLAAPRPERAAGRSARAEWALLARAQRIDREAALSACLWGFGRARGERAHALGCDGVEALAAEACSGVRGQTRLLIRRLEDEGLREAVEADGWPRYVHRGDAAEPEALAARLGAAAARWRTITPSSEAPPTLGLGAEGAVVERLQRLLNRAGCPAPEHGRFDAATRSAVRAAQAELGLLRDGLARPDLWARLGLR